VGAADPRDAVPPGRHVVHGSGHDHRTGEPGEGRGRATVVGGPHPGGRRGVDAGGDRGADGDRWRSCTGNCSGRPDTCTVRRCSPSGSTGSAHGGFKVPRTPRDLHVRGPVGTRRDGCLKHFEGWRAGPRAATCAITWDDDPGHRPDRRSRARQGSERAGQRPAADFELAVGVGPITELALTCWLGGADRFCSARRAVRFAGLDITVYSSAGKYSPGRLSRQGPAGGCAAPPWPRPRRAPRSRSALVGGSQGRSV
jgi:hypothetical protein